MKTLNTALKLTAIAAVAMTLVACGGGGGGGSSVTTNWTEGQTDKSLTKPGALVSDATKLTNAFGAATLTDVTAAHASGWKGQGVSIITGTLNAAPADAAGFKDKIGAIAPRADVAQALTVFTSADLALNVSAYVAIGAATTELNNSSVGGIIGAARPANGIAAMGIAVNPGQPTEVGKVYVSAGSYNAVGNSLRRDGAIVSFDAVNTGIGGTAINDIGTKTAYIAGSAAIIGSKFTQLTNPEIVTNMDRSRINGAFSLGSALAPKGNLR